MTMKHTPEDWLIDITDKTTMEYPGFHVIRSKKGRLIALIPISSEDLTGESEANLKLIHAAPKLFKEKISFNEFLKELRGTIKKSFNKEVLNAYDEAISESEKTIESLS